jgi:chromosome segregation ATPase
LLSILLLEKEAMATPISIRTTTNQAFFDCSEEPSSDSSTSHYSTRDSSWQIQNEFESLRKHLEEKDKTIQLQAQAIDRITKENEQFRAKEHEENQANIDLETELAGLRNRNIDLRQELLRYQQAKVKPSQTVESQNREAMPFRRRVGESFKGGVSSVGRFCRRNRRLFEAVLGIGGVVLAIVFVPYAIPIVSGVAAGIAFFDWATSWFD